jgi:hypothetical protein
LYSSRGRLWRLRSGAVPEPDSPDRALGSGDVPGEEASPQFHQFVSEFERASGQRVDSPEDFAATARGGPSRKTIKAATPVRASAKVIATTPTFSKGSSASLRLISRSTTLKRQAHYLPRRTFATDLTSPDRAERANSCTLHTLHPLARIDGGILHAPYAERPAYHTTRS